MALLPFQRLLSASPSAYAEGLVAGPLLFSLSPKRTGGTLHLAGHLHATKRYHQAASLVLWSLHSILISLLAAH